MSRVQCIRRIMEVAAISGVLLIFSICTASAGNPNTAYYSPDNNKIFWFIQICDIHIGASGTDDSNNLRWVVTEGKDIVNPRFIVATGDLTDSSDGAALPGGGPYLDEWNEYKDILAEGDIDASNFFDIPGNHDAYNDQFFIYYLANSVQGQATGKTQFSWTYEPDFGGKYHFLGVNTAANDGSDFNIFDFSGHFGDDAGLDNSELAFIEDELNQHSDADLTFVFGHHPVTSWGSLWDSYLYYGAEDFIEKLDYYGASLYGYGHTHLYSKVLFQVDDYIVDPYDDGFVYLNVNTLGKPDDTAGIEKNNFSVIAVDCNGVSTKTQTAGTWPMVLITAPVDRFIGSTFNPFAYSVPNGSTNPIRALVFDTEPVQQVRYQIDGTGEWIAMNVVTSNPKLWEAVWDASALPGGYHFIEVQATSASGTKTDSITVDVQGCSVDADCDDGLFCNGTETCIEGSCQEGIAIDCNDNIVCTDDLCEESNDTCSNIPNNQNCDDGLFCNGIEICDAVNDCQSGTPVTCLNDELFCNGYELCDEGIDSCISTGNPCVEGTCDEEHDECEQSTCGNGECDEGENCETCEQDCISGSGGGTCDDCHKGRCDGVCNPKDGPNCADCVPISSWCCGDGTCEGDERSSNCAIDCSQGAICGDGTCDSGENQCSCADDCGAAPLIESGSCADSVDNDCDDFIDCDDPDCTNDDLCPQDTCSSCFKGVCDGKCNLSKEGLDCPDCQQ
ncbi:metallophosphoesterase [Desulforhopalus singaporensis]|uniref:3',5'-cyclic AMP phosphodiesterase CpdA n=1 Tax=Desulforhopalus singaporensis TaxID=91360 RepID=A0A1H0PQP9_9BACT|nr:metallophosphoesterase [Desulforhopalus singaporensis]SDP07130.1 3',5'-cyclic AMP phosphodiesterase CpdA [Desulforhopalus singaporensis]